MRGTRSRWLALLGVVALMATVPGTALAQEEGEEGFNPYFEGGAVEGSGEGYRVGYISLGDRLPFVALVTDSIRAQAALAGLDLVVCDGDVLQETSLECGRILGTQELDGIISFNLFAESSPEICASYGNLPTISIDIHQECEVSFYGANNFVAGEVAGKLLGESMQATDDCQYDQVLTLETEDAGIVNTERMDGMFAGFASVCGEIPADKLRREDIGGTLELALEKVGPIVTTLAPGSTTIILSLNDDMALGALSQFRQQGRESELRIAAQGADPSSFPEMACNPVWIGDSAYFPERYGRTVVPAIIDILDGDAVPDTMFTPHAPITKDNIREAYPPDVFPETPASC